MEHEEQQIDVPPFATRQQLPDIRIQLATLDREFDERGIVSFKIYRDCDICGWLMIFIFFLIILCRL